jgi:hypothetical protein
MANDHIVALAQLETYLLTVLETAETAEFKHETPIAWLKAQIHGKFSDAFFTNEYIQKSKEEIKTLTQQTEVQPSTSTQSTKNAKPQKEET